MKSACRERERERENHRVNLFKVTGLVLLCISVIALSSCRQTVIPFPPFWEDDGEAIVPGEWDEYFPEGNGSDSHPYIISDQTGINQIAELVNDGTTTFEGVVFQVNEPINLTNHTPIGTKGSKAFQGTFRGPSPDNKAEIKISYTGNDRFAGIFGGLGDGALIENLDVSGSVESTRTDTLGGTPSAGLIAGNMAPGATIRNSIAREGTVKAMRAGGIAGEMEGGLIELCENYATVTGSSYTGGITGSAAEDKPQILSSINYGVVSSITGATVGGIAGSAEQGTLIQDCVNDGTVKGEINVGGITGALKTNSSIVSSKNLKAIIYYEGTNSGTGGTAGGIAGYADSSSISLSTNKGDLDFSGHAIIGGITGKLTNGSITGSVNSGSIKGSHWVGGIAGQASGDSTISGTEGVDTNTGSISGTNYYIGGIVGVLDASTVKDTTNNGEITGNNAYNIGGIAGQATAGSNIISSWNKNKVETTNLAPGGIVGFLQNSSVQGGGTTSTSKVKTTSNYAGGIVGKIEDSTGTQSTISETITKGMIDSKFSGGVIGYLLSEATLTTVTVDQSTTITSSNSRNYTITGHAKENAKTNLKLINCTVRGAVLSESNPATAEDVNTNLVTVSYQ